MITWMCKTKLTFFLNRIYVIDAILLLVKRVTNPGGGVAFQLPLLPVEEARPFTICFILFFKFVPSFHSSCSLHSTPELLNSFLLDFPECETKNVHLKAKAETSPEYYIISKQKGLNFT